MPSLTLSNGLESQVDECDYDLAQFKWSAQWNPCTESFYAVRRAGCLLQQMHRLIMGLEHGDKREVDHINHDTLDNRRSNLRIVTRRENNENRRDQSKYGVGVCKQKDKFVTRVYLNGHRHYLGTFDTPEEALQARREFLKDKE